MSNVNHRYSSESWTLDLSGKRSPLSRWTGQDLLRNEQFRLSLLGAEGGTAPVVWLAGDRTCFEDLQKTVEAYVQQGLSQPVLAASSQFPTGNSRDRTEANHASPNHTESSGSASSPGNSQFSLQALGRLRHSLSYSPDSDSPPRQMQLSMLQLADLLAVLDQWQTETLPLPERQSRLSVLPGGKEQDFAMPTWGRIAASLVVALGATGLGGYYILSQGLGSNGTQVALESAPELATSEPTIAANSTTANPPFDANANNAFGQFPINSGPPITSQAQNGDAAFNNPLVLPKEAEDSLPPSLRFPTPLPNESNLGQIPLPQTQTAGAGFAEGLPTQANPATQPQNEDLPIASADIGSGSNAGLPTQPASLPSSTAAIGTGNTISAPLPGPIAEESPLAAEVPFENDLPLLRDTQPQATPALGSGENDEAKLATAPPLIQQPSSELFSEPSLDESAQATAGISAVESTSETLASAPVLTSRQGQASLESEPIVAIPPSAATSPPSAPPAPQVIVAKPLPGNNQSRAVQTYLQSQWKPLATIQQPLQYRLSISPSGDLATVEALSPNAQLYINDAKLPPLGSKINGAADNVQSTLVVTLTPTGQVKVDVEKATLSSQ